MDLKSFIATQDRRLGAVQPAVQSDAMADSFVAMAILPAGTLPRGWGSSYQLPTGYVKLGESTPLAANETVTVTGLTIGDVVRHLAFSGGGYVLPHGTVRGDKPKGTLIRQQERFGMFPVELMTGRQTDVSQLRVNNYHQNIGFWNRVKQTPYGFHFILFTNKAALWVTPDRTPVFNEVGFAMGGDANTVLSGGDLHVNWQGEGDIPFEFGIRPAFLEAPHFQLTFAAPSSLTGLTLDSNGINGIRLSGTAATLGKTFTRAFNESFAAGVTYTIQQTSGAATGAATINASTGAVTIPNGATAGTYTYRIMAYNATSVYGVYDATVVLS